MVHGVVCVMMDGTTKLEVWSVDNLDSRKQKLCMALQDLALVHNTTTLEYVCMAFNIQVKVLYYWMMLSVLAEKQICYLVITTELANKTASQRKLPV